MPMALISRAATTEESTSGLEIKDTSVKENVQAGAQTTESTTPDALKQLASGSKTPGNILNNQIDNTNIQNLDKQDGSAVDTSRKWETGEIVITTPEELIEFAKKYNIIVLHDNAYADIVYGGRVGKSFLEYEGAKEVGVEFYSLSKTYNMTGMRISFTVGNAEIISQFKKVRSQIDYGIFPAIQLAAVAALTGPQDMVKEQCAEYERRNKALCGGLRSTGWNVPDSQGSMFVWAPIPKGYESSEQFVLELMEKSGMIVVPGTAFGSLGEGYVRFALVYPVEVIKDAVKAIAESGIIKKPFKIRRSRT